MQVQGRKTYAGTVNSNAYHSKECLDVHLLKPAPPPTRSGTGATAAGCTRWTSGCGATAGAAPGWCPLLRRRGLGASMSAREGSGRQRRENIAARPLQWPGLPKAAADHSGPLVMISYLISYLISYNMCIWYHIWYCSMISSNIQYDIDYDIIYQYHMILGVLEHTMIS